MPDIPAANSLEHLSLRAILAFALRCARRVQPLIVAGTVSEDDGNRIIRALVIAESVASGAPDYSGANSALAEATLTSLVPQILAARPKQGSPDEFAANAAISAALTAIAVAKRGELEHIAEAEASRQATQAMNRVAIARAEAASQDPDAAVEAELEAHEAAQAVFSNAFDHAARNLPFDKDITVRAADAFAYGHFALDSASKDKRDVETYGNAAGRDQLKLSSLNLGNFPWVGEPIDTSEHGPLGPLWPKGTPDVIWFTEHHTTPTEPRAQAGMPGENAELVGSSNISASTFDPVIQGKRDFPPLTVFLDPGDAPQELITELYLALDTLYRVNGGSGLQIVNDEQRSFVAEEATP